MFVKRELIKSVRMLATRLFKAHRKAGAGRRSTSDCVTEFHPTIDGTLLVVRCGDHSLSRIITSQRYVRSFACSHQWLKECEASSSNPEIVLGVDGVDFNWKSSAIPQSLRLPEIEPQPLATTPPMSPVDVRLIPALAATGVAVDHESLRYAIANVQLDGTRGTVTGTDGKRLVRYDGFTFPWTDRAILLPANDVFGSPILREVKALACGVIDNQLVIEAAAAEAGTQAEAWTLRMPITTEGRYPNVEAIIGNLSNATNRVYFDKQDLAFIVKHLKQLPGDDREHSPVTLDLNGHVDLTAAGDERSKAMRVRLSRTLQVGKATTTSMNRHYLSHAARLGITDLWGFGDQKPVVCRGKHLVYLWQPLAGVQSPPEAPETLQINTTDYQVSQAS